MKLIYKNYKSGEIKVEAEDADDLWELSQIIEPSDLLTGRTVRKIKKGDSDSKSTVIKKTMTIMIEVEKAEFHQFSSSLRVSGMVREGPEDVPHGSYHTIEIEPGTSVRLQKEHWHRYMIDKIEDSAREKPVKILVCVLDRDSAGFALLKKYGYEWLSEFESDMEKKGFDEKKEPHFYNNICETIDGYVKRYGIENVIIASPAFWKDELLKVIKRKCPALAGKITLATCCETGREGLNEVLKRDEVKTVLKQQRFAKELNAVERLLSEISKQNLAVYGFKDTKAAAEAGAVELLMVADSLIQSMRQKNNFSELDYVMKCVDNSKGNILIVSAEHEGGKKIEGLGGIAAILRYKINY